MYTGDDLPSLAATGRHLEGAAPDWAPGASMAYQGLTTALFLGALWSAPPASRSHRS